MLVMFGAVAIALIALIITFGGKHPVQRFISLFLEEIEDDESEMQKSISAPGCCYGDTYKKKRRPSQND